MPQRAHGSALIQENPHRAIRRVKGDRRRRGNTGIPFHQTEHGHEFSGLRRESDCATVDLDHGEGRAIGGSGLGHRYHPSSHAHPIVHGLRVRSNGELGHHGHILRRTDVRTRGRLGGTEVADLATIFEVVSNKGTAGSGVPTLRVTQGKELINLQWYGEKNKFLKFQN